MKKKLMIIILLATNNALAEWEYTEKLSSGDICYYTENSVTHEVFLALGNSSQKTVFDECNNNGSKRRAIDNQQKMKKNTLKEFRFGGYVATNDNILGSITLACYTGSIDSDSKLVSKDERTRRYNGLIGLYNDNQSIIKRIKNAFNFGANLRDRYPLDSNGKYRANVCDGMIMRGKL